MLVYGTPDILNGPTGPLAGSGGGLAAFNPDALVQYSNRYGIPLESVTRGAFQSISTLSRINDLNYGTGDYTFDELTAWALSQGLLSLDEVNAKRQTLIGEQWTNFVRDLYSMPPEGVPGSIVDYAIQLASWNDTLKRYPGTTWADVVRAFNWSEADLAAYVRKAYQPVVDSITALDRSAISLLAKRAFTAHILANRYVVPELLAQVFGLTIDGPLPQPRYVPDPYVGSTRYMSTVDATAGEDGYIYELRQGLIGVIPAGSLPALKAVTGGGEYNEPLQFGVDFGTGELVPIIVGERSRIPFSAWALQQVAEVKALVGKARRAYPGSAERYDAAWTASRRLAEIAAEYGLSETEAINLAFNGGRSVPRTGFEADFYTVQMARDLGVDIRISVPNVQLTQEAPTVQTALPETTYIAADAQYQVAVTSEAMRYALAQGMTLQVYYDNIRNAIKAARFDVPTVSAEMDRYSIALEDVRVALVGMGYDNWVSRLDLYRRDPAAYQALVDAEAAAAAAAAAAVAAAEAVVIAAGSTGSADVATTTALEVTQSAAQTAQTAVVVAQNAATVAEAQDAAAAAGEAATVAQQTANNVTTTTTGATAMIQVPANLGSMTEAQKVAWYRAALAAGNSDAAIRAAVEAVYGRQSDTNWTYLRAKAAQAAPAAAGGSAGLLIAAAAAYFLLG